ncbi:MAG: ABC transporter ATP-binding protein [Eubacteriales bacterium]|nr:ABC transporter ATP-binding protein [Eubacteriales bacterium]
MDNDVAISVNNVTMSFILNREKVDNLKEYTIKLLTGKLKYNKFDALKNINFEVKKGEHLAIMGLNGAGKSTLLKTIVGVYKPTSGTVKKHGVIAPLLELGAGFDGNYSGRENIFLYGAILGYDREYIKSKYDEIIEFSELGDFIDVPVKNYSSGMKARLGFSIATAVEPDILILDEVLSVGDAGFKKKSLAKVKSLFDKGVTVLFVSHSIDQVKAICDTAILLEHGEIIAQGSVDEVTAVYETKVKKPKKEAKKPAEPKKEEPKAETKKEPKAEAKEEVKADAEKAKQDNK